jgi:hypothetical protein
MRLRSNSDPLDDRPFWQQRGWQLSAVFFGLVLCAGLVTLVVGLPDSNAQKTRATTGPLTTALPRGTTRPAGCGTDDSNQQPPSQPPADVTWRPMNGANIPLSATAGPTQQFGPILWCFAHTPMGAVMAASIIPRHMSGADWRAASDQQLVAGIGREVFEARRASITTGTPQYTANTPAGFQVVTYSPQTATVRLLIRQSAAAYVSADFTVAWDNGDWKLQPLSAGELYTPVTQVTALAGFVMWKV